MEPTNIFQTIDTSGHSCPGPLIQTKKAFQAAPIGVTLKIISDNEISTANVERFIKSTGAEYMITEVSKERFIIITEVKKVVEMPQNSSEKQPIALYISSNEMGMGDSDLGKLLMKAFIKNIPNISPKPAQIVFVNGGVKLLQEFPELEQFVAQLRKSGISITICGTCTTFFEYTPSPETGILSNMHDIMMILNSHKVVTP